ncbi:MAG: bifunctional demethylmenaquinone methyltransferase/2-methoxy-6-polyprenyl-1,4-benzoquinol methylase UbiE [Thermoguttaceae bacterium]|nr:bifunctional demethylmenaquinone methyltransferase/2-methoxy-6-polyprenyl-1,4-benzoquinol methylase UbiE [Thermoguttaceae bacterium]MBQ5367405.1 bifunctional demethylmenaquinone methyltransferase/2-methoxy-6-polyprenyl-1,4-benzoquinol methylase UbiE [Thermoguttaceae bacterium]
MGVQETKDEKSVDKSADRIRVMFGEIAPKYDFLNNFLSVGLAKRWRKFLVAKVYKSLAEDVSGVSRVETLDVATGTGDVVIETHRQWKRVQKKFGGDLQLVGVDFVPKMLELARKKADRKKIVNAEFVEGDGMNLPFQSNRFDAVTVAFGLRNMADPQRGIAEMTRVCRPGGVVAILEFSPTKFPVFAPLFRFYFHKILPAIGQAVAKNSKDAYRYLPESVDAFDKPETVAEFMRQNGLEDVTRYPMTFGVLGLFIGKKRV